MRKSISLVIVACFLFLSSCSLFIELEVGEIQGLNFKKADSRGVVFEVLVPIENFNCFNVTIADVDMNVYLNNEYLGKITSTDIVNLSARSGGVYQFPLEVEYSGSNILRGALTLFSLFLEKKVDVRLTGYIKVKSFVFSRTIRVDEKSSVNLQEVI